MSQRNNSSSFFVLHSWTTILQPNFSYSHHDTSTHAKDVLLCMENHAPASTTLGEIPRERCSFVIERRTEFDVYVTTSDTKEENELKSVSTEPILPKLFAINQWCMIPHRLALCGYVGLLSTASYPANSMAGAPWFMSYQPSEKIHTPPQVLHIYKIQLLPTKMAAFQDSLVYKRGGQELLVH